MSLPRDGRWVVAAAGARDRYQVPIALAEGDALECLVTDWYSPLDRRWFSGLAHCLPGSLRGRLAARYAPGLPSWRVRSLGGYALQSLTSRLSNEEKASLIGRRAGGAARAAGAGILAYSYYADGAFSSVGAASPKVIFQVHPHPRSVRRILAQELDEASDGGSSVRLEEELCGSRRFLEGLSGAPLEAELCIAASRFTADTLVENGVAPDRVRVVPYGVDLAWYRPGSRTGDGRFRVLFVGQLVARKGLHYLLEAWSALGLANAELTLAGRGLADRDLLARYEGSYSLRSAPNNATLRELYQQADVLCVPSLVEGFGHVYLEALACGTPVIGTPNSGAPDLIRDGQEGFIVPVRDAESIAAKLVWAHEHRAALESMRERARERAQALPWERFRSEIRATLGSLLRHGEASR